MYVSGLGFLHIYCGCDTNSLKKIYVRQNTPMRSECYSWHLHDIHECVCDENAPVQIEFYTYTARYMIWICMTVFEWIQAMHMCMHRYLYDMHDCDIT